MNHYSVEDSQMYKGSLGLYYDGEIYYSAQITDAIFRNDSLVIEFTGCYEGSTFTGNCSLIKKDTNNYVGEGKFKFAGEDCIDSVVAVKLENYSNDISLIGTWRDQGDTEAYQIDAELCFIQD
jgi:nitrous oxidase accessory protein NosD